MVLSRFIPLSPSLRILSWLLEWVTPPTWPLELGESKYLLSEAGRFVVVCYNCHRKVTQNYDFFHCVHLSVAFLMFRVVRT